MKEQQSECSEGSTKRAVRLMITERYILINKPRLLRKPRFFYHIVEVQTAGDAIMSYGYFPGILLCMALLLTGCCLLDKANGMIYSSEQVTLLS